VENMFLYSELRPRRGASRGGVFGPRARLRPDRCFTGNAGNESGQTKKTVLFMLPLFFFTTHS
jgi:hypothetical protein